MAQGSAARHVDGRSLFSRLSGSLGHDEVVDSGQRGPAGTVVAGIRWLGRHVVNQWWDLELTRPRETVMGEVTDSLQRKFPSPRGVPVFEGVVGRSDPVRLRVRAFPHGARVGLMRATTRERPIKPTLSGTLSHEGAASTLGYTVTSRTGSVVALFSAAAAVVLLMAALVSGGVTAWVCLGLAIAAGGAFASYVAGVPNAEEEEQLLRQWVGELFGRYPSG
jgi:hypothetical protein